MQHLPVSRRAFVKTAAVAAALPFASRLANSAPSGPVATAAEPVRLRWLDGAAPLHDPGHTWGVPWPRGALARETTFSLRTDDDEATPVPVQSWPLAYWPDGSLKWTGHAATPDAKSTAGYILAPGRPVAPTAAVSVQEENGSWLVNTGTIVCRVPRRGDRIVSSIAREGREIARDGRLVCLLDDRPDTAPGVNVRRTSFVGVVSSALVEQSGPVRAVIKLEGAFHGAGRDLLPFSIRLCFVSGSDDVRLVHSFVYDGEQERDFIRGLGVRFAVPLRDDLHNRHVYFAGEGEGIWGEAVRNIPGWAGRFPLSGRFPEQLEGRPMPTTAELDDRTRAQLETVPAWDDYKLAQLSADHFTVEKRTGAHSRWLRPARGRRAAGTVYFGDTTGGLALGLQNFWQSHPTALEIDGATTAEAHVTAWLWSPDAPAMDLRHYSDRAHGLPLQYEDVQPGFSTPYGIARTHELLLRAFASTPRRPEFHAFAASVSTPPRRVCTPEHYHGLGVFGIWSLPDTSTPAKARLEEELERLIAFYQREVDVRGWYGFWDFGDFMHTYDRHRHEWRYDVGGYAWQNTELVPDMWLWFTFLRTGRADVFRMAEAMTRHTQEVDVYHLGRFAGLGSRHNVSHWGCGAKEARISMAGLKRFLHYLAADERCGDLMTAVVDVDYRTVEVNPLRLVAENPGFPTLTRVGPDWFGFASNWLAAWERTGDTKYRDKIVAGMKSIAAQPGGLLSHPILGYDPTTGVLSPLPTAPAEPTLSHMLAIFGGAETAFELATLIDVPEWDRAWLDFCVAYNATQEERTRIAGRVVKPGSFPIWYSRLTAWASVERGDATLAGRAWQEFFHGFHRDPEPKFPLAPVRLESFSVLVPTDDVPWMETNHAAQWSLNAIQNLALVGDHLPPLQGRWAE
jgi:hypothetical protein